jgi:xylulokinase
VERVADLLIGIDMGTGSTKGVLTTADGEIVASSTRPRPQSLSIPRPNWAEVDAESVWWADVVAVSHELAGAAAGRSIAGVCVSGAGPCLVLADEADRPLRPAILYGIDMRATAEIEELTQRYGAEEILARCGKALSTQAVGPKARWVARHEPEVWAAATRWYNSSSYIVRRLSGEYVLDHHTASQCDPLYDINAHDWNTDWAPDVMEHLAMPRLAWASEVVGTVTPAAAEQTGLPVGTPVCAGTVDAWAEAFSAGVRAPGDLMLMYGSTMFFVQVLEELSVHPQLWTTAGLEPGVYTLAAGMSTSGSLTSWIAELVGGVPFDALVTEAAAVPVGADGLLMLPYFAGERTPIFDPRARGVVAGLSLRHTRAHLFRAAYEGISYGIRQILELLDSDVAPVKRLVAVGGGTQGGLWTQIVSDVTGREQEVPAQTIGASYGDALMAALGVGLVPAGTNWAATGQTVRPDPATRATYDALYRGYGDLYPATKAVVHQLSALQEDASAGS